MGIATFTAVAQSTYKVRLTFSEPMTVNAALVNAANYQVTTLDGALVGVVTVAQVGTSATRLELILGDGLAPFIHYSLVVGVAVTTATGGGVAPRRGVFQWKDVVPRPIRIGLSRFSGQATGGLLSPTGAGQVFFSPAFGAPAANSVIEVESLTVCTRGYDVYTLPSIPDPVVLMTFPAPAGSSAVTGPAGGVLRASAHRLGLAEMRVSDVREDTVPAPVEGPAEGLLVEPIDITRASFLNDDRWSTFPATGASLGAFRTADNQTSIGPGPVSGAFPIP